MPTDPPIACSLTASDLAARLAEMAAIGDGALEHSAIHGTHAVLCFRAQGDTRSRLALVVAAEAECCAFLDLRLSDHEDAVTLTITAPSGAEPIVAELVAAFGGRTQRA